MSDATDASRRETVARALGDLSASRFERAAKALTQLLIHEPESPMLLGNLGVARQGIGDLAGAALLYRRAILAGGELSSNPDDVAAVAMLHYNHGSVLQQHGRHDEAEQAYLSAIELQPGLVVAHANLGCLCHQRGDIAGAREALRLAHQLAPESGATACNLAAVLLADGDVDGAEALYRAVLDAEPNDVAALTGQGAVSLRRGHLHEGIERFEHAVAAAPTTLDPRRQLAAALAAAGRLSEAESHYREARAHAPRDARLANGLGAVVQQSRPGDSEAATLFDEAAALAPQWDVPWHNLGALREQLGELEQACVNYRRAMLLQPEGADYALRTQRSLAGVLHRRGHHAEAAERFRSVLSMDPDDAVAAYLLAALSGVRTCAAPAGYVQRVFDDYAARYDEHMVGDLEYRAAAEIVRLALDAKPSFDRSLDLGCGTGLVGAELRAHCGELVGVDLSPAMLDVARESQFYDSLHVGEVCEFLKASAPGEWHLIAAADVFVYVGDLAPILAAASVALTAGGFLAFTVEVEVEANHFVLGSAGRYRHSARELREWCRAARLEVVREESIVLRKENGVPVQGLAFLLGRAAPC